MYCLKIFVALNLHFIFIINFIFHPFQWFLFICTKINERVKKLICFKLIVQLPYGFNSIYDRHLNPVQIVNIFGINRFWCFTMVIVRKTLHQLFIQNHTFLLQCKIIFRFIIMLAITYWWFWFQVEIRLLPSCIRNK